MAHLGARVAPPNVQKYLSTVSLKVSCVIFLLLWHVSPMVVQIITNRHFHFCSSLSSPLKIIVWPSWLLVFQLQSLFFLFLNFGFGLFIEVFFLIPFLNPILPNIIFSNLVLMLWISSFLP